MLRALRSTASLKDFFREGSVRGSVFNLCSATLGAGALSLPYAFAQVPTPPFFYNCCSH